MGRSRGGRKKLHWSSIQKAVAITLGESSGPSIFTTKGLTSAMIPLYWELAKKAGHYTCSGDHLSGADLFPRIISQVAIVLRALPNVQYKGKYGRNAPRKGRFDVYLRSDQNYWTIDDFELPESLWSKWSRTITLGHMAEEE